MKNKGYLTVQELAEICGIGLQNAYELASNPHFPSIKINARYLIPRPAFEAWFSDPKQIVSFKRKAECETKHKYYQNVKKF